jgi:DNA-binding LacI/PurR family transcriptional regulator
VALSTPQITALELNPREMGGRATAMLARLLSGQAADAVELVPVELVPRASTTRLG